MNAQLLQRRESSLTLVDHSSAEKSSRMNFGARVFVPCRPGKSSVRNAVLVVVIIHVLFLTGLLLRGSLDKETKSAVSVVGAQETANRFGVANTALELPTSQPVSRFPTYSVSTDLGELPPTPAESAAPVVSRTIVKGDSFARIAKQLRIPVATLLRANPGVNPARLQLGQKINVPIPSAAESK
jgi:LysM repeat protein